MTEQQAGALARALERARANGLAIVGRGTWDRGGARFFVVGSASEPGRFHLVTVHSGRLACDCPSRALCMHRALAHAELEREAHAEREAEGWRQVERAIEGVRRAAREATRRDTALPAAALAPARPFSVFKAS